MARPHDDGELLHGDLRLGFDDLFRNSVIVSLSTAAPASLIAAPADYAFSRFAVRGKLGVVALMLLKQMFPLLMIIVPIYKTVAASGC